MVVTPTTTTATTTTTTTTTTTPAAGGGRADHLSRPLPLPAPVAFGLRAVFGSKRLTSIFYDSEASDNDEPLEGGGGGGATGATGAGHRRRQSFSGRVSGPAAAVVASAVPEPAAAAAAAAAGAPPPPPPAPAQQPPAPSPSLPRPDSATELEGALAAVDANRARVHTIRRAIVGAGDDLRAAHPWLEARQDAIGAGLIVGCVAANVAAAAAFGAGALAALPCVLLCAFAQSILHEIEHDLIHSLYFQRRYGARAVNAALAAVYACRLSTLNPWSRRRLHLHHHNASGTASDLEERAITNGLPWNPLRLLVTGDNLLCVLLRPAASLRELRDYIRSIPDADPKVNPGGHLAARAAILAENAGGYLPGGLIHYGLWYAFLVNAAVAAATGGGGGFLTPGSAAATAVTTYAAAFGAPNFLRTFCLHFVSSNIHYAGIARGDVLNQTQVLTHPLFAPFQLFCANFGGTHAIHHFVVRDPFYIRQAIAGRVLPVMRAQGVRFNDIGTFWRANRVPEGTPGRWGGVAGGAVKAA